MHYIRYIPQALQRGQPIDSVVDDSSEALLLSVCWEYAQSILDGTKRVELRRTRPRVETGSEVLIYAPTPQKVLLGGFTVSSLITGTPSLLWRRIGRLAAISRNAFDQYFEGTNRGYGIMIDTSWELEEAIPLVLLRERLPGFHPPQAFRYLRPAEVKRVLSTRNA